LAAKKKTISKTISTKSKSKAKPKKSKSQSTKPKFRKRVKSKQTTPLINEGYKPYVIEEKENPKTKKKDVNISHMAGPITAL